MQIKMIKINIINHVDSYTVYRRTLKLAQLTAALITTYADVFRHSQKCNCEICTHPTLCRNLQNNFDIGNFVKIKF